MAETYLSNKSEGKPFYKKWWGILLIFLFFPILVPYLVWTKTSWNKWVKIGITAVCGIFLLMGFTGSDQPEQARPAVIQQPIQQKTTEDTQQTQSQLRYKQLGYENNGAVDNYFILVPTDVTDEQELERIARAIKDEKCSKDCNVALYDERKAFELDREYSKMTNLATQNEWKQQNYVYVADHHLGLLDFSTGEFLSYPYKDWQYEELK